MSAVDDWLYEDDDEPLEECSECGHEHFDPSIKMYLPCPLADDGCTCPYREGETPSVPPKPPSVPVVPRTGQGEGSGH